MKLKRVLSALVALTLTLTLAVKPVLADEAAVQAAEEAAAAANANQSALENQMGAVQGEVSELQNQLNTIMTELNNLELQLIEKGQQITLAEQDLKAAEERQAQQYEDMKLRIKYMYEVGDNSALSRVFESGSIAELLSQAEYVEAVHTYDRNMLDEYIATVQEVKDLKATLESEQAVLQDLEGQYQTQSDELNATIIEKSAEIENLDAMIQEAAIVALAAAQQVDAERAQLAAEQAAAAAAAAAAQAAQDAMNNQNNYVDTTPGGYDEPSYEEPVYNEPAYDVYTGNAIVDRAWSWVGRAEYVWGACSPGAFDCSGFVSYCLTGAYARLGTTYTFLTWNRVSEPQPGDVCVNSGHCGIYIGGGQMIHAADYGIGVIVGPVQGGMVYVRW